MVIKTNIQPNYKQGATKSVIKYALFPHRVNDVIVWLGRYEVLYVYNIKTVTGEIEGKPFDFTNGEWIKASERTI